MEIPEGGEEITDGEKKESVSIAGMSKDQRKEHKKQVKMENKEKRKIKTPKYIKKKAEKKNKK